MAKYKDWRTFDPVTMRNEKIRNTPETARGGYSALAPVETVSATVPKLASDTPDWAKRTPTEQARVNAAQARAQAEAAPQGYAALAPASAPVSPYAVPESPYNYGAPKIETATKTASVPTTGTAPSFANLDDASKAQMKQNNPALYNQLLVQGIISPLAEDQKQTATSSATEKKTVTVQKASAEAPASGGGNDTAEPTGYAKYLADHPEYAEADRRAEAEYARSLPTYGALAERMAQAGIHGGYGEYLDSVAYAQMQSAKQTNEEAARQGYKDYLAQQEAALTGNGGTNAQIGAMYEMFGKGGYTDAEGNTVQGYNLLEIVNDEDYENAKARARADAINQGADEATVDAALKRVDEMRGTVKGQVQAGITDKMTKYNEGKLEPADLIAAIGYTPREGEDESIAFLSALDYAVENKLISPEQRSEALKVGLSLYGDKPSAKDVLKSVKTAIDLNDEGAMTAEDKNAVLEDALKAVETYFKGKKWTVKIENGKLYAKNTSGVWEDLGNLKYNSEFETIFRGSYYEDVVKLVYENRNKN